MPDKYSVHISKIHYLRGSQKEFSYSTITGFETPKFLSFCIGVKVSVKWRRRAWPLPLAAPARDHLSSLAVGVHFSITGTCGLHPGWGTWLSLSWLQSQPVKKLSTCPRDIDTHTRLYTEPYAHRHTQEIDTVSPTDCHRQGGAFNCTHV